VTEPITADPAPRIAPIHLAIRFALELVMWGAIGYWGWHLGGGGVGSWLLAIGFTLISMVLWGVFRTRGDSSGRQDPPVAIPGAARLALELALFGLAGYGVWTSGSRAAAETLLTIFVLHFAVTWNRVAWLMRQK
jgi:hypothetical protein